MTTGDDAERYPPRCSQCGQRWIDRACGPTHAVVADRLGLTDLRLALMRLHDAVTVEGRSPRYHREQMERLSDEWPTLARTVEAVLREAAEPMPRPWPRKRARERPLP